MKKSKTVSCKVKYFKQGRLPIIQKCITILEQQFRGRQDENTFVELRLYNNKKKVLTPIVKLKGDLK